MIPVILSGGSGTRLWPVSRTKVPKQFCEIFGDSLQLLTLRRLRSLGTPWIITSATLKNETSRVLTQAEVPSDHVIFEPVAKNTAPAIALLCLLLQRRGITNEVVGVFPADHLIEKNDSFYQTVRFAEKEAQGGKIVTLGILPDHPATGFGYIETEMEPSLANGMGSSYKVKSFHEKPSFEKAEAFLSAGSFYWNAGIFIFRVTDMVDALRAYQSNMWNELSMLKSDLSNLNEVYQKLENKSIDYAIMEHLSGDRLSCVPCDIGWSDVGSWDAVSQLLGQKDSPNSVSVGSKNNFVFGQTVKTYAFVGVEDLIVVDTADALLVTQKGASQRVKDVVDLLKAKNPKLVEEHIFENRPWGRYEVLRDTESFKSKVIHVLPSQQLSLQSHKMREEHWIVTKGQGEVVLGESLVPVQAGSYVKIPLGAKHRMRNTGTEVLEFVEIQMGSYFGEDDIVRYQDDYHRV